MVNLGLSLILKVIAKILQLKSSQVNDYLGRHAMAMAQNQVDSPYTVFKCPLHLAQFLTDFEV